MTSQPFCTDCPDHEACSTGYPCHVVKEVAAKPAYLDPVRHELHQLRATLARVEEVAQQLGQIIDGPDDTDCPDGECGTCSMGNALALLRAALADKEPTP